MKKTMLASLVLLLVSTQALAGEATSPATAAKPTVVVAQAEPAPTAAPANTAVVAGIRPTGFWMEGHLGTSLRFLMTPTPSFSSGVVLGYKLNRLVVGVGLDLSYDWNKDESDSTHTTTTQDLGFALGPVVEYILGQFGPVGFFLTGAGHFLMAWHKEKTTSNHISIEDSTKTYGFDFKAGAGGRFYLGGRVGIGLELGMLMLYTKGDGEKNFGFGPYTLLTVATIW